MLICRFGRIYWWGYSGVLWFKNCATAVDCTKLGLTWIPCKLQVIIIADKIVISIVNSLHWDNCVRLECTYIDTSVRILIFASYEEWIIWSKSPMWKCCQRQASRQSEPLWHIMLSRLPDSFTHFHLNCIKEIRNIMHSNPEAYLTNWNLYLCLCFSTKNGDRSALQWAARSVNRLLFFLLLQKNTVIIG